MTQLGFVILNSTLYTGLFLFVLIKFGLKNLGAIMLLFYMLSSWFSVLFFLHPLYTSTFSYVPNGIEIEGVLYLFTINLLLIIPFLRFDTSKIRLIKDINLSLFYNILYICSIIYLIIFIVNIPKMYNVLQSPVVMLTELREDIYVSGSHGERIFIIEFLQRVFGGLKYDWVVFSAIFKDGFCPK